MKKYHPDYILLGLIIILVIFGLLMVASASVGISQEGYQTNYYYLKNQITHGLLPGLLLGLIAYFFPYRYLKSLALPAFIVTIIGLILVFVPGLGLAHGGAKRWVTLGPIVLQPSEFLKVTFLI